MPTPGFRPFGYIYNRISWPTKLAWSRWASSSSQKTADWELPPLLSQKNKKQTQKTVINKGRKKKYIYNNNNNNNNNNLKKTLSYLSVLK